MFLICWESNSRTTKTIDDCIQLFTIMIHNKLTSVSYEYKASNDIFCGSLYVDIIFLSINRNVNGLLIIKIMVDFREAKRGSSQYEDDVLLV